MKVKKVLPLALLTGVMALGMVGCSDADLVPPSTYEGVNTKITIWATAEEEQVIKAVVDEYNAKQENDANKFNYDYVAVKEGDAGQDVAKDPAKETAPALFLTADDHIYNLQNQNILLKIGGAYEKRVRALNSEPAIVGSSFKENLYGFPVTSDNGYFLWYDSSVLSAEDVTSLETILQKAKSLGKSVLYDAPNGWYSNSILMSPQACGTDSLRWYQDENKATYYETTWDNAVGVKVAEYMSGLMKPYYADNTLVPGGNDQIVAGFKNKTMIAAVSGTWMENDLKAVCDTLAATKLPEYHIDGKGYQMSSFTGSKVYCINKVKSVAEQKAAAALADLLTNKDSQLKRYDLRKSLPCNLEAAKDPAYTENVSLGGKALNLQNQFATVQSLTAEGRYWDIGAAIGRGFQNGLEGDVTWKDFLTSQCEMLRAHKSTEA